MTVKQFNETYLADAIICEVNTGISHYFTLGQAGVESGWGEHAPGYNFFGIKAKKNTPVDQIQLLNTKEWDGAKYIAVKAQFMKYPDASKGFEEHGKFFFDNKRYANALPYKNDPYRFAEAIAKSGYATDPNYAVKLKNAIKMVIDDLNKK
jgi:flagellar protein FlgJ